MRRDVHDLHVVGDDEFFQSLRNFLRQARFEIQKQFVRQTENVQVAFHFALGGDERGVTTFTDAQFFHVVRHLAVQKPDAVGAGQANPAAETQIQNAGALAQRGVFGRPVAIIVHDFRAIQSGESRAEAVVKFMQWQRSHFGYLAAPLAKFNFVTAIFRPKAAALAISSLNFSRQLGQMLCEKLASECEWTYCSTVCQ